MFTAFRESMTFRLAVLIVVSCLAIGCADDDLADASTITFHIHNESSSPILLLSDGSVAGGWLVIDGLPFLASLGHPYAVPESPLVPSELCDGAKLKDVGNIPPPEATVLAGATFDYAWKTNAFMGERCGLGVLAETCCIEVARVREGRYTARVCAMLGGPICPGPVLRPTVCRTVPIIVDDRNREADITFTPTDFAAPVCP